MWGPPHSRNEENSRADYSLLHVSKKRAITNISVLHAWVTPPPSLPTEGSGSLGVRARKVVVVVVVVAVVALAPPQRFTYPPGVC